MVFIYHVSAESAQYTLPDIGIYDDAVFDLVALEGFLDAAGDTLVAAIHAYDAALEAGGDVEAAGNAYAVAGVRYNAVRNNFYEARAHNTEYYDYIDRIFRRRNGG